MRRAQCFATVLGTALVLSSCGPGYGDLPLPGSNVHGKTYELSATFDQALNLPQGAQIKVGGRPVGRVQSIRAVDYRAVADLEIRTDTVLRSGSTARLRYDTPLGELFVEVTPSARGRVLQDGDAIDRSHTSTAPTVEDTLASASLLVNGGGLAQSETIVEELNNALGGREQTFRQSLTQITDFLRQANQSTRQIDQVLFALRDVSKVLDRRRSSINAALTELRPAARVLHDNTDELVAVLQAADRVSVRSNALMTATRDDFLQVLRQLGPILDQVLATKPIYADSLRNVLRADVLLKHAIPGDYFPVEMMIRPDLGGLVRSPVAGGAEQSPDSSGADLLAELLGLLPGTGEPTPGPLAGLTGGGSGVGGEPSEGTSDSGGGSSDPLGELLGSGLGGGR